MRNLAIQIPRALGPPVARALIDSCGRTRSAEPAITAILSGKWLTLFRHLPSCKLTNIDPENSLVLMETNLPNPMTARVYVNLPEGKACSMYFKDWEWGCWIPKERIVKRWIGPNWDSADSPLEKPWGTARLKRPPGTPTRCCSCVWAAWPSVGCGLQPKRRVAMQCPNTSDASLFHGAGVGQKKGKLDTKNS